MKVDVEALTLGFMVTGVSVGIFMCGPVLIRKWQDACSDQYVKWQIPARASQVLGFIWWCQRAAIHAFGIYGMAFGTLLLLTGIGLVDGFAVLDRVDAWLGLPK